MNTTINILLIFLFGLVCSSCNTRTDKNEKSAETNEKTPLCNLKIALDTTFDYRILYSKILLPKSQGASTPWTYDSITKTTFQNWDSLAPGNYTFEIKTIFRTKQQFHFTISTDTSFIVTNQLGLKTVAQIDKNELLSADTIELVYTSNGCFHGYFEKLILIKNKAESNYFLKTNSKTIMAHAKPLDIQKNVSSEIIDDLYILQNDSKKQKDKSNKSGILYMSTTRQNIYLLVNGKLFKFDDTGIKDWNLYDDFKTKYITQTKDNST